ncbi:MAG TPA: zf-HC2 domain-containing protein [Sphingomicrobium sp.]|nr:zf-HC2 domain-containing protein [Sphingomicrobium sp.]
MPDIIQTMIEPHHEAEELLPWYVTGQLGLDEQSLVEKHVSNCAHCRRQLAFERRMIDEFASMTPEVDSGWARLRRRLEPQRRESLWEKIARDAAIAWQTLTRPAVAALATAQLLFLGLAGTLIVSLSQPSYEALGSAPPSQSANVIAIFSADTTQAELAALLRANGASLVGGPTPTDAYLIRVPASSRQAALERLRSNRHVVMAEPIDGKRS